MEHLALDGRCFEDGSLGGVELVEASREQRLDRRRRRDPLVARLLQHRRQLLDEQRVAVGGRDDALRHRGVRRPIPEPGRDHLFCFLRGERLEAHETAPARPPVEQLRPRHADEQDRRAGRHERDMLDQVEQCFLGPLDVVEDEHERPLTSGRLDELAERPRELVGRRGTVVVEQRAQRR